MKTLKLSDIQEYNRLSDYIKLFESDLYMIKQQYLSVDNKLTDKGFVVELYMLFEDIELFTNMIKSQIGERPDDIHMVNLNELK